MEQEFWGGMPGCRGNTKYNIAVSWLYSHPQHPHQRPCTMSEPILQLTGLIYKGDSPGVFVGCIKEMRGVVVQGASEDAVYRDLVEGAKFLVEFKHEEALQLLRQQINAEYATDDEIEFSVNRQVVRESIAE